MVHTTTPEEKLQDGVGFEEGNKIHDKPRLKRMIPGHLRHIHTRGLTSSDTFCLSPDPVGSMYGPTPPNSPVNMTAPVKNGKNALLQAGLSRLSVVCTSHD